MRAAILPTRTSRNRKVKSFDGLTVDGSPVKPSNCQTGERSNFLLFLHRFHSLETELTPIHNEKLIKLCELEGFQIVRKRGDHIMMTKPGIKRPVVIKTSPREVPVTHIKTNLNSARISRERYFELLEKVR
jgi:predicted RNA binding protein YcfA (HicA-like mRNA interferase family)